MAAAEQFGFGGVFTITRYDAPLEWYGLKLIHAIGTLDQIAEVEAACADARWYDVPQWIRAQAVRMLEADLRPYDTSEFHNNVLPGGPWELFTLMTTTTAATTNSGGSAPSTTASYNATQARLAIGDSSTAFANTQTWLQAATNKYAQVVDALPAVVAYASGTNQAFSAKATVAGGNANFAWNEFCLDNGGGSNSTSTTFTGTQGAFNRAVSAQGTKTSGQSWALTITFTAS